MESEANVDSKLRLTCTICNQIFSRPFTLKRHERKCMQRKYFPADHHLKEGEILKEFNTFGEFIAWKEEEEKITMSNYVKHRGMRSIKNGDKIVSYHCCRSGTYNPRGKGVKSLKSQGSAKIGTNCPAGMKVKLRNKNVVVHYFPKHENHEAELEHLRLSQSDRTVIAERLKEGVSANKILQDIRDTITIESGRKMLIAKKDINNIKRDYNIKKRHNNGEDNREENCIFFEAMDMKQKHILKEAFQVLPSTSQFAEGQTSLQNKLDYISAFINECHFTDEEENKIHKHLNAILNVCYTHIEDNT